MAPKSQRAVNGACCYNLFLDASIKANNCFTVKTCYKVVIRHLFVGGFFEIDFNLYDLVLLCTV